MLETLSNGFSFSAQSFALGFRALGAEVLAAQLLEGPASFWGVAAVFPRANTPSRTRASEPPSTFADCSPDSTDAATGGRTLAPIDSIGYPLRSKKLR